MRLQQLQSLLVRLGDESLHFGVDGVRRLFAEQPGFVHLFAEEGMLFALLEADWANLVAHTPVGDHPPGDVGRLLDVALGSGRELVEEEFLGSTPTHAHGEVRMQPLFAHVIAFFFGLQLGDTQGAAAGHDGDLVDRVEFGEIPRNQGVTRLVVGGDFPFALAEDLLALGPHQHLVFRDLELGGTHLIFPGAGRHQGGFVDQVLKVGPREANGSVGDRLEVDGAVERHLAGVHLQNAQSPLLRGAVDGDVPIEAARTEQGGVEHIGPVGRRQHNHRLAGGEPVHLPEDLVESLLAFVVATPHAGPANPPDGVNFVDEQDAGGIFLRGAEHVAHATGPHPHEHLDELGAIDRKERDPRLARGRPRQQGLARPRGAHQ